MTTTLDDLPPPDTHCFDADTGKDVWSYSPGLVREIVAAELRKAQEGQEPVARLTRDQIDAIMTHHYPLDSLLRENVDAFEACVRDIEKALFASPPPKSDEARDALIRAARWFADNPDSPKSALIHITEALAALDAQQSKGEA